MATQYPTTSSQLIGGPPLPSYGAFQPNNGLHRSGQRSSRYAAPGPPSPASTQFPDLLPDFSSETSEPPPPPYQPWSPAVPPTRAPSRPTTWTPSELPASYNQVRSPVEPSIRVSSRPVNTRTPFEPTYNPFRKRNSKCCQGLIFWLVTVMVTQVVLITYRSNTLAKYSNLEFTTYRASRERSALSAEREKSGKERAQMERDRRLWGKVPENHIPPGAYWKSISPAYNCQAYGKREYWGMLQDIPEGWTAMDACMNTPANIKGVTVRRPDRCAFVSGSPHVHGYWTANWDQEDCKPWHKDIRDIGCTNHRSGLTRIEAKVEGIINRKEQDWRLMCESTPFTLHGINYTSPLHCEERAFGAKIAMWDVPSENCRY